MPAFFPAQLPDWPRAAGEAPGHGRLRSVPEDFRVTERMDVVHDGDGEHDWLWIAKRGANTAWVARQLARHAGVAVRDVGFAGLKDRHAETRQWFSVRRPAGGVPDWRKLDVSGVRVLDVRRHRRKLRRGAHRGNDFDICIRDWRGDPDALLETIRARGVPNYFGEQRFGRDAGNLALASRLLAGERLRRDGRSLALSAARAFLFNEVLARRVRDGSWDRLLPGEQAMLAGSRSRFAVDVPDAELERRCAEGDLHPSGPLWGRGADTDSLPAAERDVLGAHRELASGLERLADADRRPLRLVVDALTWHRDDDRLQLSFSLPAGAFATAVLRELLRPAAQASRSST